MHERLGLYTLHELDDRHALKGRARTEQELARRAEGDAATPAVKFLHAPVALGRKNDRARGCGSGAAFQGVLRSKYTKTLASLFYLSDSG